MRFVLQIELGNDAMNSAEDVAVALRQAAETVASGTLADFAGMERLYRICDVNGNTVGGFDVVDELVAS